MEDNKAIRREAHLTYLDEFNKQISGWVEVLEETETYLRFKTHGNNIITISHNRLLRMKERGAE